MKTYEKTELLLLSLFGAALAVSWDWATKVLILLMVWMVVKAIWSRRMGNPAMASGGRVGLGLMLAYFAIHALSLLYSQNQTEGVEVLTKHLPFLLIPLLFLLSDMSYLRRSHLRGILHLFLAALIARFFVRIGAALGKTLHGTAAVSAFFTNFDPMHHAYLAMYTLLGLTFIYYELLHHGEVHSRLSRALLIASAAIMVVYTYLIQSRAGVLCMAVLLTALLIHLALQPGRRRLGVALLLASFAVEALCLVAVPSTANRLGNTLGEVASGDTSDVRFDIWRNAAETSVQYLPFGTGIGDRMDALAANYPDSTLVPDSQLKLSHVYNPHNQYLDTLLATGLPGLLALLALLLWPLWRRLRHQRREAYYHYLLPLTLIAALSFPFESILERQMGILFLAFFYALFLTRPREA